MRAQLGNYDRKTLKFLEEHKKFETLQENANDLGVEVSRLHKAQEYGKTLRRKFPHIKPERLARKVLEVYKIKIPIA